jgi:hypothetical protein
MEGTIAAAMRGCLDLGYDVFGVVEGFDTASGHGTLDVQGQRREVA